MSKLHRRGYLAISTIAAASALLVAAPAGASAAAEGSSAGSASGETVVEPSGGSTQPADPAATEWTPQGDDSGASGGGGAPLEHGSSVGSGVVTENAGSDSEAPPYTPDSSGSYEPGGSYEPEPSTPSTVGEPAGTPPQAGGGIQPAQPRETAAMAGKVGDAGVGTALSLGHSASPRGAGIGSAPPAAPASFTDSGGRVSTSSYALSLLVIVVFGLVVGFAAVRLRRRRLKRRLEAFWREQDEGWEAALRRVELEQVSASESSAQWLQRVNVA
ncbi:MAG TPA: hypothetical protein VFM94_00995 [Solirubrobacterales bacterium]|nr:hypothetical protein [Solirubrobacterales bacterium]